MKTAREISDLLFYRLQPAAVQILRQDAAGTTVLNQRCLLFRL